MATLDLGKVKGSTWYAGDGITGTSTTPTAYSESGVTYALAEDLYLNTTGDDRANVYQCTLEGDADTALWVYVMSIKGDAVEVVNNLNSDSTTKALSAKMGKELYNLMKTAGIYPLCVTPTISDTSYTASLVVKDVNSTFTVTDMDDNQGTYSYTSQGGDTATVIITIGTSIGLPNNGAVIKTIESSDAEIFSYELYDNASTVIYSEEPNIWKHITDDELNILPYTSITEGGNTYKSGIISKIISAVRTTLYPVTHAKAVWFSISENKTVHDKIEMMDDNIAPTEVSPTVNSYDVGDSLIYNGVRYKVKSSIAAGTTLTIGTNIEAETVAEDLKQINSDLSAKGTYVQLVQNSSATGNITVQDLSQFGEIFIGMNDNPSPYNLHEVGRMSMDLFKTFGYWTRIVTSGNGDTRFTYVDDTTINVAKGGSGTSYKYTIYGIK
jgi:hypothetical protein